jgi:hypothetical protein
MLSGATLRASDTTGTAVLRIVVSSDSIKKATATSHGNNCLLEVDDGGEDVLMRCVPKLIAWLFVESWIPLYIIHETSAVPRPVLETGFRRSFPGGDLRIMPTGCRAPTLAAVATAPNILSRPVRQRIFREINTGACQKRKRAGTSRPFHE